VGPEALACVVEYRDPEAHSGDSMMLLGTMRVHGRDLDVLVCWRHRGAVPGQCFD